MRDATSFAQNRLRPCWVLGVACRAIPCFIQVRRVDPSPIEPIEIAQDRAKEAANRCVADTLQIGQRVAHALPRVDLWIDDLVRHFIFPDRVWRQPCRDQLRAQVVVQHDVGQAVRVGLARSHVRVHIDHRDRADLRFKPVAQVFGVCHGVLMFAFGRL